MKRQFCTELHHYLPFLNKSPYEGHLIIMASFYTGHYKTAFTITPPFFYQGLTVIISWEKKKTYKFHKQKIS